MSRRLPSAKERPAPASAAFDKVRALLQLHCGEAELADLAVLLLDNADTALDRILAATAAGDLSAVREAAHRLKGSVAFFAADRAQTALAALENAAAGADTAAVAAHIPAARAAIEELQRALRTLTVAGPRAAP